MALISIFDGIAPRTQLTTHDVKFDELGQRWESIYLQRRAKDLRGCMDDRVVGGNVETLSSAPPTVDESAQPPTAPTPKRKKQSKESKIEVRLTPEQKAELEAMTTRTTMSRFVRNLIREEGKRKQRTGEV
jgi:hypothetical protein